jgi:hypothetical protein
MRGPRGLKCEFALKRQIDFSEPQIRINVNVPDANALRWNEHSAWDELAEYYKVKMAKA